MKMAKDSTVTGSLVILVVGIILGVIGLLPKGGTGEPWYIVIAMLLLWLAVFRLHFILPIQTLIHAVKYEPQDKRVKWVVAHLLLWPVAGIAYYLKTEKY
jgi:hypothetical protein